ncbi:hypothetical protein T11_1049, partial [Trichinella zimbabwensis]
LEAGYLCKMPDRLLGDKFSKSSPLNFCSVFGQRRCFALGNGSSLNQAVASSILPKSLHYHQQQFETLRPLFSPFSKKFAEDDKER